MRVYVVTIQIKQFLNIFRLMRESEKLYIIRKHELEQVLTCPRNQIFSLIPINVIFNTNNNNLSKLNKFLNQKLLKLNY